MPKIKRIFLLDVTPEEFFNVSCPEELTEVDIPNKERKRGKGRKNKNFKEWNEAETIEDKQAIETIVSMSLADFDEDRFITDAKLLSWIKEVKY